MKFDLKYQVSRHPGASQDYNRLNDWQSEVASLHMHFYPEIAHWLA